MPSRKILLISSVVALCAGVWCGRVQANPADQAAPATQQVSVRILLTDTVSIGPDLSASTIYYCSTDDTITITASASADYSAAELLLDNHTIQKADMVAKFSWLVEGPGLHTLSVDFLSHGNILERTRPYHVMVVKSLPVAIGDFDRAPLVPFSIPLSVTNDGFSPVRMGVLVDDKPMPVRYTSDGYQCAIPVPDLGTGHHSLRVEAWDISDNRYEYQDTGFDIPARFKPSLPTSFIYTGPDDKLPVGVFFQPAVTPGQVDYYLKKTKGATGNLVAETYEIPFRTKIDVSSLNSGRYYMDIVATTADGHSYLQGDVPVDLQNQVLDAKHAADNAAAAAAGAVAAARVFGSPGR